MCERDDGIAITDRSYRLKDLATIAGKGEKNKKIKSKPRNARPQNRRAEGLAFRFCSFYLDAGELRKHSIFTRIRLTNDDSYIHSLMQGP
jgi:hypothetical protein